MKEVVKEVPGVYLLSYGSGKGYRVIHFNFVLEALSDRQRNRVLAKLQNLPEFASVKTTIIEGTYFKSGLHLHLSVIPEQKK